MDNVHKRSTLDDKKGKVFLRIDLKEKASVARDLGAKGIIFIQDSNVTNTQIARFDGSTKEKISYKQSR